MQAAAAEYWTTAEAASPSRPSGFPRIAPGLAFQRDFARSTFHVLNFLGEGRGIARFLQSMLSYFDFPWTPFKLFLRPSMKDIKLY